MRDRIARAFGNFQDVQNGYISGAERRAGAGKPYGSYRKTVGVGGKGNPLSWSSLE